MIFASFPLAGCANSDFREILSEAGYSEPPKRNRVPVVCGDIELVEVVKGAIKNNKPMVIDDKGEVRVAHYEPS